MVVGDLKQWYYFVCNRMAVDVSGLESQHVIDRVLECKSRWRQRQALHAGEKTFAVMDREFEFIVSLTKKRAPDGVKCIAYIRSAFMRLNEVKGGTT